MPRITSRISRQKVSDSDARACLSRGEQEEDGLDGGGRDAVECGDWESQGGSGGHSLAAREAVAHRRQRTCLSDGSD